jgi:TRAP-type mannitol/chloroaromatic compound transport system permease small subunit
MLIVLGLIAILLYESISRSFFNKPNLWSLEMAQFAMAAYYMLGGAYALKHNAHARMDLFYHTWTPRKKAFADVLTFVITLTYLSLLLYGALDSALYAIEYDQRSYSSWKPSLIPIKAIMTVGVLLMFLQSIAELIKDVLIYNGYPAAELGREEEGE